MQEEAGVRVLYTVTVNYPVGVLSGMRDSCRRTPSVSLSQQITTIPANSSTVDGSRLERARRSGGLHRVHQIRGVCSGPQVTPSLTSNAKHWLAGTPIRRIASRYGSGNGLARSHSLPMTSSSKNSVSPSAAISCSALARGALVTAARRRPAAATHWQRRERPERGVVEDRARLGRGGEGKGEGRGK